MIDHLFTSVMYEYTSTGILYRGIILLLHHTLIYEYRTSLHYIHHYKIHYIMDPQKELSKFSKNYPQRDFSGEISHALIYQWLILYPLQKHTVMYPKKRILHILRRNLLALRILRRILLEDSVTLKMRGFRGLNRYKY